MLTQTSVRIAVGILAVFVIATSGPAVAQTFLDQIFGGLGDGRAVKSRHVDEFGKHYGPGTIVVSFGDRRLYYVMQVGKAISYPIGVPQPNELWSGTELVSAKRVNPDWRPTSRMRQENPDLPSFVPGGHPRNPLGVRALYLGDTLYRIHGTDAPWTIGQVISNGCIRLFNEDIVDLYERVPVGAKVVVTLKRLVQHHGSGT